MKLNKLTRHLIPALLLLPCSIPAQESQLLKDEHVTAQLVGEMSHLQPGVPYRLGLILNHDPRWHTYWKSTATGYATSIEWNLPEGFTASGISWPVPKVYDFQGWTEYVYEGKVLLMTTITLPNP
jgi:DsbC/DsbD-like thiol-disulfide interchange protein